MPTVSSKCAPVTVTKSPDFTFVALETERTAPFGAVIDVAAYAGVIAQQSKAPRRTTDLRTGIR
jgi:hypothetical protein